MAPKSGEFSLADDKDSLNNDNSTNESEDIWSSILQGVASSKIVPTKSLLILGDRDSGKSTLIRQLKGEEDEEVYEGLNANGTMSKSVGTGTDDPPTNDKRSNSDLALSYTFIEVKDDDAEDTLARLGLYQLAGSFDSYQPLLRFALNSSTLPHSLVVIVLDWARPWTFIETLQKWIKFVELGIECVKKEGNIGSKDGWTKGKAVVNELKELLEKFIQKYSEPDVANPNTTVNSEEDDVALPLGQGVLTTNLAVPLVVVCTKSDNVSNLERELDYKEDQFDYIQQTLRTICLKYGAGLFYTTTRQPQTFVNLRKYILHRLLGSKSSSSDTKSAYTFNIKAHVVERDTVLVPTGWDSWGKIKVLRDGFDCEGLLQGWELDMGDNKPSTSEGEEKEIIGAKKLYEDVAVHEDSDKPLSVPRMIIAEDEQDFFNRHYDTLQKANSERQSSPSVVGPMGAPDYSYCNIGADIPDIEHSQINVTPSRPKTNMSSKAPSLSSDLNGNASGPPSNGPVANQNEVLANFFQNLLSKKNNNIAPTTSGNSQSPNEQTANPVRKQQNGSSQMERKLVEKELDKLRNIPNSTTASAGK
ncbi:16252_t:CDS:2 [Funneliformis geosporum]|uniref:6176_t:CDS:1 n=1 Tax=Funneliformis geosporum TaxID=1117311 RepID=A0A9W4WS27_9GLOM|nr:16252_t:CDS:2 [Funneliformis geosporum]CAI2174615.1 6176_t:CDS:2 [Funneliformis geosporum]